LSLLYSVVFASRCRSNHHRLAVDALRHLKSPDAELWQNLLLHFHDEYLKGAKAPDEVFKDFKNHVLHVRDGDWGGAIEACEEWQRRTVRALKQRDWAQAAWSAGVMSHYYVDPIQPFHTHQTEEEGVIHRAVEWSFSKSYKTFQAIIARDGGYPEIDVPDGDDWLRQMVRAGALTSTPHYETIIEHYNLEAGVKDPPAGLDQELKEVIARLVGHAVIGLARILDRTFAEAAVKPPNVGSTLQGVFLALEMPIQAVLAGIDDAKARAEVAAQYEEFRRTGKVRATLGEDDKVVRELFAAEVLKTPLSSLDAKWPREIGAKAGAGAQPPVKAAKPKPAPKIAALPKAAPALKPEKPKAEKPKPEPVTQRFTLDGEAPVLEAPSIGPKTAKRLEAMGVKTVADLLAVSPDAAQAQIAARHISAQVIKDWQAQALLACTVPGLRSREAQALVACGVRDATELVQFEPGALTDAVARWGLSEEGARAWGNAPAPTEDDVADWIERAKNAGKAPADLKRTAAA
jgi:predicted flap endonuclease-1-like 5' DNA nuclease